MFDDLFEPTYGVDNSPKDDTRIIQIILYFDEPEINEFKTLAKNAMRVEFPENYVEKANLSDLFLLLLKKYYGNSKIEGASVGQGMRNQISS